MLKFVIALAESNYQRKISNNKFVDLEVPYKIYLVRALKPEAQLVADVLI